MAWFCVFSRLAKLRAATLFLMPITSNKFGSVVWVGCGMTANIIPPIQGLISFSKLMLLSVKIWLWRFCKMPALICWASGVPNCCSFAQFWLSVLMKPAIRASCGTSLALSRGVVCLSRFCLMYR